MVVNQLTGPFLVANKQDTRKTFSNREYSSRYLVEHDSECDK